LQARYRVARLLAKESKLFFFRLGIRKKMQHTVQEICAEENCFYTIRLSRGTMARDWLKILSATYLINSEKKNNLRAFA
jgi:hypothetical protein